MGMFIIVIALGLIIIFYLNSHQDKEIQESIKERNEIKLLNLQTEKKELIAFKNAVEISNRITNLNENYKITSLSSTKIVVDSYKNPEISIRLIWDISDCNLKISIYIHEKNEKDGVRVSDSIDFYGKSENEILDKLKVVFERIQHEYSVGRFIYL